MQKKLYAKGIRKLLCLILTFAMVFGLLPAGIPTASAKTDSSDPVQTLFFYVSDKDGNAVLAYAGPIDDLEDELTIHGYKDGSLQGKPYCITTTDNLPITNFNEGKGFTIEELLEYIDDETVPALQGKVTYAGSDVLAFKATDSGSSYSRSYTYDALLGVNRYYFPKLIEKWTAAGFETNSGSADSNYDENPNADKYNTTDKNDVFENGIKTPVYLAVESYAARTNAMSGWETYQNEKGNLSGYFSGTEGKLDKESMLRLTIPLSEKEMRTGQRTNANQFKWVYDIKLTRSDIADRPEAGSGMEVPAPTYTAEVNNNTNTLKLTLSSTVEDAKIYTSFNGSTSTSAAQFEYTAPIEIDITGKDLKSSPITFYARAVKEGYSDAGRVSFTCSGASAEPEPAQISFAAEADAGAKTVGTPFTVTLGLNSDKAFTLYGAQITMKVKADEFDVGTVTPNSGWESGVPVADTGYKYATFTFLNVDGAAAGVENTVATIKLTPKKAGNATISWADSKLTDASGEYIQVTAPGDIKVTVTSGTTTTGGGSSTTDKVDETKSEEVPSDSTATKPTFPDASGHWAEKELVRATETGILTGYADGTVKPNAPVSRAEFAAMAVRAFNLTLSEGSTVEFSDTGSHWAKSAIQILASHGIVSGYGDGGFLPNTNITRQQGAAMMKNLMKLADADDTVLPFTDAANIAGWALPAVKSVYKEGIMQGNSKNEFLPGAEVSRAEAVTMILRALDKVAASTDVDSSAETAGE